MSAKQTKWITRSEIKNTNKKETISFTARHEAHILCGVVKDKIKTQGLSMLSVESNRKRDGCCSSVGDISHGSHLVMADGGLKVFLLPLSRGTIERIKSKAKENGSLNVEQTFSFAGFRYFYALRVRFDTDQTWSWSNVPFYPLYVSLTRKKTTATII